MKRTQKLPLKRKARSKGVRRDSSTTASRPIGTGLSYSQLTIPDAKSLAKLRIGSKLSQPAWLARQFPAYTRPQSMTSMMTSVRQFDHQGHEVTIATTYRIEVDGRPIHLHMLIDDAGQVHSHYAPFTHYASAVDLVSDLLTRHPDLLKGHINHRQKTNAKRDRKPKHRHSTRGKRP